MENIKLILEVEKSWKLAEVFKGLADDVKNLVMPEGYSLTDHDNRLKLIAEVEHDIAGMGIAFEDITFSVLIKDIETEPVNMREYITRTLPGYLYMLTHEIEANEFKSFRTYSEGYAVDKEEELEQLKETVIKGLEEALDKLRYYADEIKEGGE